MTEKRGHEDERRRREDPSIIKSFDIILYEICIVGAHALVTKWETFLSNHLEKKRPYAVMTCVAAGFIEHARSLQKQN